MRLGLRRRGVMCFSPGGRDLQYEVGWQHVACCQNPATWPGIAKRAEWRESSTPADTSSSGGMISWRRWSVDVDVRRHVAPVRALSGSPPELWRRSRPPSFELDGQLLGDRLKHGGMPVERAPHLAPDRQLMTDIANLESGLEIMITQLARQPTLGDLAKTALGLCSAGRPSRPR